VPYYAHKEEKRFYLLSAHLAETAAGIAERLCTHPRYDELVSAALLCGLTHDFGKYTRFFQHYLRTGKGGPEKQHAFSSALWAAHLAEQFEMPPLHSLALFVSVCRHHRSLADPEELLLPPRELTGPPWDHLEPTRSDRLQITQKQIDALGTETEKLAVARSLHKAARHTSQLLQQKDLHEPSWLNADWSALLHDFLDNWTVSYGRLYRYRRQQIRNRESVDLQYYFDMLTLFSTLIDADKIHAARLEDVERASLPRQPVKKYREKQFGPPTTDVDRLRDELYNTVCHNMKEAPLSRKIFTITAPTGSGKTLAALASAFILRNKLEKSGIARPRIIYALPFTSIVDQTYGTIREVLSTYQTDKNYSTPPSSWLLKHHHLAENIYHTAGESDMESLSLDKSLLLIESWQSEIIVTTFVQLLHTFVGNENRMLKKFHRLQNSILILDEVQNIPVEYWPLVENVLREACHHLGTRVLLLTATRPEWFGKDEILELGGADLQIRRRFATLDRVTITANLEPFTVEELADNFLKQYNSDQSYLVILNTIKSSITFHRLLKEKLDPTAPLYYLSTNITPVERSHRLQQLRELLKHGSKPVLVSTQVVEAGVDLDFDEVWRDLGPVDAVVQAAGRCNRHFSHEHAYVRVWHLVNRTEKNETSLAQYVYGKIHTHAAKVMFEKEPQLRESNFYETIASYFETVRQAKSTSTSNKLLEAMQSWRFSPRERDSELLGVANFALIEDRPHYLKVFVELDEDAANIWHLYQTTVIPEKEYLKRREAYLSLKRDFNSYTLSVPAKLLVGRLDDSYTPLYIPNEMLEEFYDPETGFARIDDEKVLIL
jgi:CRISPR-associated endonuclease/helicase Cas3